MHYITDVQYDSAFKLFLQFEDGSWRIADLKDHLDGDIFEPLRNRVVFSKVRLNEDIDTVVWENGADMSPDFLYKISSPADDTQVMKAAEEEGSYKVRSSRK